MSARYVIDPLKPFPKRWRDRVGPFRVMGEPIQGYVLARRPHAYPFVLSVAELLNATVDSYHGPFECLSPPYEMKEKITSDPKQ